MDTERLCIIHLSEYDEMKKKIETLTKEKEDFFDIVSLRQHPFKPFILLKKDETVELLVSENEYLKEKVNKLNLEKDKSCWRKFLEKITKESKS